MTDQADPSVTVEAASEAHDSTPAQGSSSRHGLSLWLSIAAVAFVLLFAAGGYFLWRSDPAVTAHVRDLFLVLFTVLALIVGLLLVLTLIAIVRLIDVVENGVLPVLNSAQRTTEVVKGTTTFLSKNLVTPVIKVNGYAAAVRRFVQLIKDLGK
jgi:membrane protein implicated in regulation of membrane protease activity